MMNIPFRAIKTLPSTTTSSTGTARYSSKCMSVINTLGSSGKFEKVSIGMTHPVDSTGQLATQYEMFVLRFGDFKKPTIFIESAIHGSEPICNRYLEMFMKFLAYPSNYPLYRDLAYILRSEFSFAFLLGANPWGVEMGSRYNARGQDLNRDFVTVNGYETQNIKNIISSLKPIAFIDCHWVGDEIHDNSIGWSNLPKRVKLQFKQSANDMLEAIVGYRCIPFAEEVGTVYADGWASTVDSRNGTKTMGFFIEDNWDSLTYGKWFYPNALFTMCLYVLEWHKHRTLNGLYNVKV